MIELTSVPRLEVIDWETLLELSNSRQLSLVVYLPVHKPAILFSNQEGCKDKINPARTNQTFSLWSSSLLFSSFARISRSGNKPRIDRLHSRTDCRTTCRPSRASTTGEDLFSGLRDNGYDQLTARARTSRRSAVTSSGLTTQAGEQQKAAGASLRTGS